MMYRLGRFTASVLAYIARVTPNFVLGMMTWTLGEAWFRVIRIRRAVAICNMVRALDCTEKEALEFTRQMYHHFVKSVLELFLYGTRQGRSFAPQVKGIRYVEDAIERGQGVILVTAHIGNWELLVRYGASLSRPLSIVTGRMSSAFFGGMWSQLREGGPSFIKAKGSAMEIRRRLLANELVGFVLDQHDPSPRALHAPFLGRLAATNVNLARMAHLTKAVIIPVFITRDANQVHKIIFQNPIEPIVPDEDTDPVRWMTNQCLRRIESTIEANPEQWLWIHRRWKVDDKSDVQRHA